MFLRGSAYGSAWFCDFHEMKIKVYNQKGEEVGKAELPSEIFEVPMNMDLVHQAVVAQMANMRVVHAHTKDRSEVRGGGRKPWRQKGTGRARHGSRRSPIWIGGGVTFGPTKERSFKKKINKKMKRKALFMALSSKAKDGEILLLDELKLKEPKTRKMVEILENVSEASKESKGAEKKMEAKTKKKGNEFLVVIPEKNEAVARASRNIPTTKILRADSLNVLDVLSYKYLLMPKKSIEAMKDTYMKHEVPRIPTRKTTKRN